MFRWAIKQRLARGQRPGVGGKRNTQVPKSVVDDWLDEARTRYGIKSILALIDESQLRFYSELPSDLIRYYRSQGFQVAHISAPNMRKPALSRKHLKMALQAYQNLEKPVLIHCSAGIGRTGAAVHYVKQSLRH